jgi:hypothetical protein
MIGQSPSHAPSDEATRTPEAPVGIVEEARPVDTESTPTPGSPPPQLPTEWGGREGPEPTRYGDWEKNGRCIDF